MGQRQVGCFFPLPHKETEAGKHLDYPYMWENKSQVKMFSKG